MSAFSGDYRGIPTIIPAKCVESHFVGPNDVIEIRINRAVNCDTNNNQTSRVTLIGVDDLLSPKHRSALRKSMVQGGLSRMRVEEE
jgi:hypothetical protein